MRTAVSGLLISFLLAASGLGLAHADGVEVPIALDRGLATGVNDRGMVVGWSPYWPWGPRITRSGGPDEVVGWVWQDDQRTEVGTLGGTRTLPRAINKGGAVVGSSETADGTKRAFLWTPAGRMADLGTLGGVASEAMDISVRREIVGWSEDAQGNIKAFHWRNGRMRELPTLGGDRSIAYGINEFGDIVGQARTAEGSDYAVLWDRHGQIIELSSYDPWFDPERPYMSIAYGLNDKGDVVGHADYGGEGWAFRVNIYDQNSWLISNMSGYGAVAYAINNDRVATGATGDEHDGPQAFLWNPDGSYHRLPPGTYPGQVAYDISNSGVVVGSGGLSPDDFATFYNPWALVWNASSTR